jgi:transposase
MSEAVRRVEVITSVQRRRRWSVAEKIRLVEETLQPGMSVSLVARKYRLSPSLLFNWRRRMAEGGREAVRVDDEVIGAARVRRLEERIRELERLLGRKTLEVEMLKKALAAARAKNRCCAGRRPIRTVPDEGRGRHARGGTLEPGGAGEARLQPAATPVSQGRRRRAAGAPPASGRRPAELRLSADHRALEPPG